MPIVKIPPPLKSYVGGLSELSIDGETVEEVLSNLVNSHPAIKNHLYSPDGSLRTFINIFIDRDPVQNIKNDLKVQVDKKSIIKIIASMAGGLEK